LEEGSLYRLGLVGYKINEILVCCESGLVELSQLRKWRLTLQEALDVAELACIVEFPKVFGLLREVLPLGESVSLVCDKIRGYRVELRNESGEVDVWRIVSLVVSYASREFALLHAPIAFWNLFPSSCSSSATGSCLSALGGVSTLSSISTPPSMVALQSVSVSASETDV